MPAAKASSVGAAVLVLGSAIAPDASAGPRLTCALAIKSVCGDVSPRGGQLRVCFEAHMDQLTGPCGDKLSRAAATARACESDARKFCGGVRRARRSLPASGR